MKRFKNSLFFVSLAVLLVFGLGFVSAQTCSDPSQIIMKLNNETNAHGELWSESNYGIDICHDTLFGYEGIRGDGSAEEVILKMSSSTNAHGALANSGTTYSIDVFFGQVECVNREVSSPGSGNYCDGDEKELVRLVCDTSGSNCHFGAPGSNYFAGGYNNYAVCCTAQNLENAEWWNMVDEPILNANLNDRVNMHVDAPGFDGFNVKFAVAGHDVVGWTDISEVISSELSAINVSEGVANFDFKITSEIIDAGAGECAGGDMKLKFEVSEATTGLSTNSGELEVDCYNEDNSNPVANITEPVNGEIYLADSAYNINFKEESTDEDDYIEVWEWEVIQDGTTVYEKTLSREGGDIDGDFTDGLEFSEGQATVKLTVTDERGKTSIDEITLVILGSNGGAGALIEIPGRVQDVVRWESGGVVVFNGTESYVISYPGSNCTLTCIAGSCPAENEINIDGCSNVFVYSDGDLSFGDVNFKWEFNDVAIPGEDGMGLSNVTKYYHSLVSDSRFDKTGSLIVSWSDGIIILDGFGDRDFTMGQCINGGNTYLEIDVDAVIEHATTLESGWCDLPPYGRDIAQCCPAGMYCDSEVSKKCEFIPTGEPQACADYSSETSCENDMYNVAINDPAGEGMSCPAGTIPKEFECDWNNNKSRCELSLPCGTTTGDCTKNICTYSYTRTECGANGYMDVTYTRGECQTEGLCDEDYCSTNGGFTDDCPEGTETVPCGRLNFELGFFEYAHFFAVTLIISLIYLSIYWRKEERE